MKKIVVFCLLLLLLAAFLYFLNFGQKRGEETTGVPGHLSSSPDLSRDGVEKEVQPEVASTVPLTPVQKRFREKFPIPGKGSEISSSKRAALVQAARDYKLGKESFGALQGHTPRAASLLRKAVVKHELSLIGQYSSLSQDQKKSLEDIFAELFDQEAQGQAVDEVRKLELVESVIGAEGVENYTALKDSLKEAEQVESISRRLEKLDSDLDLSSEQSTQVEAALYRLEERKSIETSGGLNSKEAHQGRVAAFEEELQSMVSAEQFESYLTSKPKRVLRPGPNPFSGG